MPCTYCHATDDRKLFPPANICYTCLASRSEYNCLGCGKNVVMENIGKHMLFPENSTIEPRCLDCTIAAARGVCPQCNQHDILLNTGKCAFCSLPNPRHCNRCTKHRKVGREGLCTDCSLKIKKIRRQAYKK